MVNSSLGLYVVDVTDDTPQRRETRFVVIAQDAETAEFAAVRSWAMPGKPSDPEIVSYARGHCRCGRIGDYDPGITGARLTVGSLIVARGTR